MQDQHQFNNSNTEIKKDKDHYPEFKDEEIFG